MHAELATGTMGASPLVPEELYLQLASIDWFSRGITMISKAPSRLVERHFITSRHGPLLENNGRTLTRNP